jgi:hypothetical protein
MREWHDVSNYIVILAVPDETSLTRFVGRVDTRTIPHSTFQEPDLNDALTAVAVAPCAESRRLCSSLPLALRDLQEGAAL